ncbi:hypothetical protein A3F00_05180 [Candidatus Daviesbacteria bacterium RIFCSPHIGHO2_12_FULL_37_11]|uniref:Cohesin domain-containing protein n=1 Tax=Candidatus Daviesbacteria bacterium RIFCSPHIGHO2_12_FULL_37_11 TaxID=1797777 RepID=A0A1F5KAC8_9BACT|nr:MAG: hypothetical protein A2111_01090 [Candidatus Daviesbacteria bacterium GWA1_38_6]OGE37551.1 MAG: hypothetical protein A3F00_05180 [Candidatus Daviesbacteria bacterium RIFCSPHIGHO2_12_FULL_37_11]
MDQTPNILINPETAIPIGIKKRFNLKYLFIILGAVVLIEIIIGVWVFLQKNSSAGTAPGKLAENQVSTQPGDKSVNAKLSLSSVKNEFKVGEVIPVTISIDTDSQVVDGVDVVLNFDPAALEASSASITTGTIFPEYPVAKVEKGIVRITAITSLAGVGYSGSGIFATINFKAKQKGQAKVTVDFTKGSTTDTNIVGTEFPDDMLSEVKDLEVNIK